MTRVRETAEQPFVVVSRPMEAIAELSLNRPERRNALTLDGLQEICDRLTELTSDPTVRAVLLTASGPSFCAGADLHRVHNHDSATSERGLGTSMAWERLETVTVPVIAAVQGHAITGGFQLALCCDLVVAAEDAVFQDTHAWWGLIPGSGEAQRLARRVGIAAARDLMLTSRPLGAEEAHRIGLVARLAPSGRVREMALSLAQDIADNNQRSVSIIKRMLNSGLGRTYGEARWTDAILIDHGAANRAVDPDRDDRLRAFRAKDKRAPSAE